MASEPSSATWSRISYGPSPYRKVFVLVVDPESLARDATFRSAVERGLDEWARIEVDEARAGIREAEWHPVDWSVVVVRPTAKGPDRFVGPTDVAALGLHVRDVLYDSPAAPDDGPSALALARAARDAIEAPAPSGPFRPIRATNDLLALLTGARAAESPSESALVTYLDIDRGFGALIGIATLRDDEDGGSVAPLSLLTTESFFPEVQASLPASSLDLTPPRQAAAPRLGDWLTGSSGPSPSLWPCDAGRVSSGGVFPLLFANRGRVTSCASRPVLFDPSGIPECSVGARLYDLSRKCEPSHGFVDPPSADGRATWGEDELGRYRACDIAPSPAPEACALDAICRDCASGVCLLPPDAPLDPCPSGQYPIPIRFTGGALVGSNARIVESCRLVSPAP